MNRFHDRILTGLSILGLFAFLYWAQGNASEYHVRLLNNCAIFITLAVSYNLINGICGQFSLAPNAFVAIGAYASALLTMSPAEKQLSFMIEPLIWPLNVIAAPFWLSLVAAGLISGFLAFLIVVANPFLMSRL